LRTAFEQKNTKELNRIMTENANKIFSDSFLEKFRDDLNQIVGKEMLVVLVASYRKVSFNYLS